MVTQNNRTCTLCKKSQDITNFAIRKDTNKHYWQCNNCKKEISVKWNKEHSFNRLIISAGQRAKSIQVPCTIDVAWIINNIKDKCPCCGIPFKLGTSNGHGLIVNDRPSIDRFNLSLGYTPENSRIICTRCNRIKNEGTGYEHIVIGKWIQSNGPKEFIEDVFLYRDGI